MVLSDCYSWADDIFGFAELGDLRRTRRLVTLASSQAQCTGLSIVKFSRSSTQVEGAYRLIRNPAVLPDAIADADFAVTTRAAAEHPLLLALEDSTSLNFGHSTVREELGSITNNQRSDTLRLLYAPGCAHIGACWHLLTSEKVENTEQARAIVCYYERRWLREEYHKAWKSGDAQVEQLRMQTRDNLERMMIILAFVAVRVLALQQGGVSEVTQNESCESLLSPVEWKLLWVKQERKALPESPPPLKGPASHWQNWGDGMTVSEQEDLTG